MRWLGGILIGAAIVGATTYLLRESSGNPSATVELPNVEPPVSRDRGIAGIGYVEPAGEVRRLGFKIDGRIRECRVQIGSRVSAGDLLARLDDAEEQAAVRVAFAEVESAKARLAEVLAGSHPSAIEAAEHQVHQAEHAAEFAARESRRLRSLRDTKSTSDTEADKAESLAKETAAAVGAAKAEWTRLKALPRPEEKGIAEAHVKLAEARLSQANARLEQTRLLAPFPGTVLEILKRDGDLVRTFDAEPVILFADTTKLRVRAEVDERFVHQLEPGMVADIHGRPLGDKVFAGTVSSIKEIMGPKTVFSRAAAERVDLDVVQLFIDMPAAFVAPIGLRADVNVRLPTPASGSSRPRVSQDKND